MTTLADLPTLAIHLYDDYGRYMHIVCTDGTVGHTTYFGDASNIYVIESDAYQAFLSYLKITNNYEASVIAVLPADYFNEDC